MQLIDYNGLVSKGVARSRMTLKRLIQNEGFPTGWLISPNARVWDEAEVEEWIRGRATASRPQRKSAPQNKAQ